MSDILFLPAFFLPLDFAFAKTSVEVRFRWRRPKPTNDPL